MLHELERAEEVRRMIRARSMARSRARTRGSSELTHYPVGFFLILPLCSEVLVQTVR
jgi:hypothetical protein